MASRITSSMLSANYLRDMRRNLGNMQTLQSQLSSGKEIQKASDNPYKTSRSMQLNTEIAYNKQFNENIKDTSNWLDTTDTALSQIGNIFGRIETLLVNAGNGTYGDDERIAIQDEIKEKVNELSQVLNTSFDGSYIFGGTKTTSKPTTVVDGILQYASLDGNALIKYLDEGNNVTDKSSTNNTLLSSSKAIYLDQNGKVTTSSKNVYGINNTKIIQGNSLYVDTVTGIVSTSKGSNSNSLVLKDELYMDLNGNITQSKTSNNTLITTDNELFYLTVNGTITTSYDPTYTLIPSGTTLYKQSDGKVTTSSTTSSVPLVENEKIDEATPLYTDEKGIVTTTSVAINSKLSSSVTSVNTLTLSKYTPSTGYSQETINPSCDVYIDSRGILTNLSTTDLSMRGTTLNELWTGAYIDSVDQKIKNTMPIPAHNNKINLYKDSNGLVTTSPGAYPANEQILLGTNLYKTADGKVTTIESDETTPVQLTDKVYVNLNGSLTTSDTVNNQYISIRDNLSISQSDNSDIAKAVIGTVSAQDIVIPSNTINLYINSNGNITKDGSGVDAIKIILSDSLYLDSYENITVFPNTQNVLMNSDDKLYKDANGNVTKSSVNTQVSLGTILYKDQTGRITTLHGDTPPNEIVDLNNITLYKDGNGNITTASSINGVANTQIDKDMNLYKDINGNITIEKDNKLITSDTQLYRKDNGSVTTNPIGITALTTQLYKDGSGNVTNIPIGNPATNGLSGEQLYLDENGNILVNESTAGVKNIPISQTTKLYIDDSTGKAKTNLIKTGEPLYVDTNGKIITDKNTENRAITSRDNVYIDSAENLTMSKTSINKKLSMSDVIGLKNEYSDSSTTETRKTQIKIILDNKDVAQLLQINSDLQVDISQGVTSNYNKTVTDVLEFTDKTGKKINVSDLLSNIISDLGTGGDKSNLTTTYLSDIQSVTANLLQQRSEVGSLQNRMDSAKSNNETQNYNMTDILSKTEDIDFTEKTMEYAIMQTVYTAALQTSAKILPMTILSYL